jgi:hypothetical protein
MRIAAGVRFIPNDLWIGLFWTKTIDRKQAFYKMHDYDTRWVWNFFICVLPCLPLHIRLTTKWVKE